MMTEELNGRTFVKMAYAERQRTIIIGLTGRTGSGCSTVASILKKGSFDELDLQTPLTRDYSTIEERKYAAIYDFFKSKRGEWEPFYIIEASAIIFSFILERPFSEFIDFVQNRDSDDKVRIGNIKNLLSSVEIIKDKFDRKFNENEDIIKYAVEELPQIKQHFINAVGAFSCQAEYKEKGQSTYRTCSFYTYFMQIIGNNIRRSGNPYCCDLDKIHADKCYSVAERINVIVKKLIEKGDCSARICIDAIRNPYEAFYFKDRYSSFYLTSVNVEENVRKSRLTKNHSSEEILSMDITESDGDDDTGYGIFYHQTISSCLEIADIHIYNRQISDGKYYDLTKQLVKYVSLMLHPGLVTPSDVERCMQIAYNVKVNSGCLSRQVGAVITNEDFSVKAVGWNDVAQGQIPCNLRSVCLYCTNHDEGSYSKFELEDVRFNKALNSINSKISMLDTPNISYPYCFKDVYNSITGFKNQVHTRSLHAEENAFLQLSKYGGTGIKGGRLFATASPCELCSKKAYQLGIKDIYYIDPYPGIAQSHILSFGKEHIPHMQLYYGAIGSAYSSLFTQRMSVKDELEIYTGINTAKTIRQTTAIPKFEICEAEYGTREMTFTILDKAHMREIEEAQMTIRKDCINMVPIPLSWTGDRNIILTDVSCFLIGDTEEKEDIKKSGKIVSIASGESYIEIQLNKQVPINSKIIYTYQIEVNDSKNIMLPFYSCFIRRKTEKIILKIEDYSKSINEESIEGKCYAGSDINKDYLVKTEKLDSSSAQIETEPNSWVLCENSPQLLYTYAIIWKYSAEKGVLHSAEISGR